MAHYSFSRSLHTAELQRAGEKLLQKYQLLQVGVQWDKKKKEGWLVEDKTLKLRI